MILQQILDYLRAHDVAGIHEIARAVESTPDAVHNMLQTLQRKGRVHRYRPPQGCGTSCRQCAQAELELYRLGPVTAPSSPISGCAVETRPPGTR